MFRLAKHDEQKSVHWVCEKPVYVMATAIIPSHLLDLVISDVRSANHAFTFLLTSLVQQVLEIYYESLFHLVIIDELPQ
jgi:hypothetical protein